MPDDEQNRPNRANNGAQQKAESDFLRNIPKYHLGTSFELHTQMIAAYMELYPELSHTFLKGALFASLHMDAFKLVSPEFSPANVDRRAGQVKNFQEYTDILMEIFEPSSEREQARIEFESRTQVAGEHPTIYYRDKLSLFQKGYESEKRDWSLFYNKVISGFINAEMRDYLRLHIPSTLTDTNGFRNHITKIANIVRRKYLDGELNEDQTLGAEAFNIQKSYLQAPQDAPLAKIKQEPIQAVTAKAKPKGACYHCGLSGHFKAQCSRFLNGLPKAVNVVEETEEPSVEAVHQQGARPKQFRPVRPFNRQGQFSKNKRFQKRRVMFVYEQPDGQLVCEPIDDADDESEPTPDQSLEEKVEALGLEGQPEPEVDASDFIPHAFLGMR